MKNFGIGFFGGIPIAVFVAAIVAFAGTTTIPKDPDCPVVLISKQTQLANIFFVQEELRARRLARQLDPVYVAPMEVQ